MFLVCHFSMMELADPVLHAPLDGVVGGPALTIAHWYPAAVGIAHWKILKSLLTGTEAGLSDGQLHSKACHTCLQGTLLCM